jgi:large subunit ribosomal protein L31
MKHPETRVIDVVCTNCGESHRLRTTAESMSVDICSNCHPAYTYTGAARITVGGDRVERFNRRLARVARFSKPTNPDHEEARHSR